MTRALPLALILCAAPALALAQPISGSARVIDGDTIEVAGQRIRLWGVDAPELRQTCESLSNPLRSKIYSCGRDAAAALIRMVRGRVVTCQAKDTDRYQRIVATCSTGEGGDLGAAIVRQGWATDYTHYSGGAYKAEEAAAKAARAGMRAGQFTAPAEWRQRSP